MCAVCGGDADVVSRSNSNKVLGASKEKPCQNQVEDDPARQISDNASEDSGNESNPGNEESKASNSITAQDKASLSQECQQSLSTPSVVLGPFKSDAGCVETPPNASADGHDVSEKPSLSCHHPILHSTGVAHAFHAPEGPPILPSNPAKAPINHDSDTQSLREVGHCAQTGAQGQDHVSGGWLSTSCR
jgi:hypothetical protein